MLLYSIKPKNLFITALDNLAHRRNASRAGTSVAYDEEILPWDKLQFNNWFRDNVEGKYKVGDLLCPRMVAEDVPHLIPWHFRLEYINEVYKDVRYNKTWQQAVVLNCKDHKTGTWYYRIPANVRHLTKGEMELVHLYNCKIQGLA